MAAPAHINALARAVIETARDKETKIATAESCTGGMIGAALTDVPGSSAAFDCGFITYSNEAKTELLGVPAAVLEKHGAVSAEVAEAMAAGALVRSRAGVAVSVTGIAGPDGGAPGKPVGLVWFGLAKRGGGSRAEKRFFSGDGRDFVRTQTVETALTLLLQSLTGES